MRLPLIILVAATARAFKSSFINLGGVKHHYRDTGESDGPLALFFHGFAGSAASFEDVAPLLAAKNVRCIGVDRVAFGLTARPAPASLPAPPKLPGSATLAASLEGGSRSREAVEEQAKRAVAFAGVAHVMFNAAEIDEARFESLSCGSD